MNKFSKKIEFLLNATFDLDNYLDANPDLHKQISHYMVLKKAFPMSDEAASRILLGMAVSDLAKSLKKERDQ